MTSQDSQNSGKIMVLDDHPNNLRLLEDMLGQQGYSVRSFPRGRMALTAASQNPPDLILLDINMPEMTGYEVCDRLKSDPNLARIPILFLSALNETEDKVRGFRAGAVDYVTKPFQFEEVQARIQTHLRLVQTQRALREHNEHLEEVVAARTQELAAANGQLRTLDHAKGDFLKLISHEFRTPLNGLLGVGDMLLDEFCTRPEDQELRGMFEESRRRILTILDDAALLTEIDVDSKALPQDVLSLTRLLTDAIELASDFARSREVAFQRVSDAGSILGDEFLLKKALQALLETAVKFSISGECVRLSAATRVDTVSLTMEAHGRIVPASALPKFFDLFSIGEAITPGGDLGLGPPVAHRIISLFGGSVEVANITSPAPGMRVTVSLKRADSEPSLK